MGNFVEIVKEGLKSFVRTSGRRDRRLTDTLIEAYNDPEKVVRIGLSYYHVAEDLLTLPTDDLAIITEINKKLGKGRGADTFRLALAGKESMIRGLLKEALNQDEGVFGVAVNELGTRMDRARAKRAALPEWRPFDGDEESDNMIWGQTNGANDPWIDVHFMLCHLGEQLCNVHLKKTVGYCGKKDWSFATTDVIVYYGLLGREPEKSLLEIWRMPRPEGLGWASESRMAMTRKVLEERGLLAKQQ